MAVEINKCNFEEGSIYSLRISNESLEISISKWNKKDVKIIITDYTRLYEYNSIGREISNFEVHHDSDMLVMERKELREMDVDEEECNQLIHLKFVGYSELPLLDIITNKSAIQIIV